MVRLAISAFLVTVFSAAAHSEPYTATFSGHSVTEKSRRSDFIGRMRIDQAESLWPADVVENGPCGYMYGATVLEPLKGALSASLTFSSNEKLTLGRDYLLFLLDKSKPITLSGTQRKLQPSLYQEPVECADNEIGAQLQLSSDAFLFEENMRPEDESEWLAIGLLDSMNIKWKDGLNPVLMSAKCAQPLGDWCAKRYDSLLISWTSIRKVVLESLN